MRVGDRRRVSQIQSIWASRECVGVDVKTTPAHRRREGTVPWRFHNGLWYFASPHWRRRRQQPDGQPSGERLDRLPDEGRRRLLERKGTTGPPLGEANRKSSCAADGLTS